MHDAIRLWLLLAVFSALTILVIIFAARRILMAVSDLQAAVATNTSLTSQVVSLVNQLLADSVPPATVDALTASVTANNQQLQSALDAAAAANPAPTPTPPPPSPPPNP